MILFLSRNSAVNIWLSHPQLSRKIVTYCTTFCLLYMWQYGGNGESGDTDKYGNDGNVGNDGNDIDCDDNEDGDADLANQLSSSSEAWIGSSPEATLATFRYDAV